MTAVATIAAHLSNVQAPDDLRNLPGWLMWRYEPNGDSKPRKVPYYPSGQKRSGAQGRPDDRRHLTNFDAARAAAARRGFDGVGLALMPEFNICALDFDNCVENGAVHPEVQALLGTSYAEYSPSGHGIRAFFKGQLGNHKSHGLPFGFETFSTKGFVTFSGNTLEVCDLLGNGNTIAPIDAPVTNLFAKRFKRELEAKANASDTNEQPLGLSPAVLAECLDVLPEDMDYDAWVNVGMAIHHETQGEGFELWDEWSQRSPKYTDREYGIARWNSFGKGTGLIVTARSLVRLANSHGAHILLNGPASMDEFDALPGPQVDGIAGEFDAIGDAPAAPAKALRFPVLPIDQFASGKPPAYIIKGVLPKAELVVLYGESGSGKSFMALDMAMAIVQGLPWRGRKTKKGRVVYIAAEGAGGFRNRVQAYAADRQLSLQGLDFGVIHAAPNLLLKPDALDVAQSIDRADVVIVDTWAQTTPGGNENSGEDMGRALTHCKGIHRRTGAVVVLVHHAGKDASKGARGWSGLRAAADAELEVVRNGDARALRLSKQKDGEDGTVWGFSLETVNIGIDEDDEVITSCVVREAANELPGPQVVRKMGANERIVNAVIQEFAEAQTSGIEVEEVAKEAVRRMPDPEKGARDTRLQKVRRAIKTLCEGDDAPYFLEDGCLSVL